MPLIDHRLAFLLLCALLLGAAIPIVFAWANLFPEDDPPFQFDLPAKSRTQANAGDRCEKHPRDPYAVVFLTYLSLSYLWQFPGLPREAFLARLSVHVPVMWMRWSYWAVAGLLIIAPAGAVVYSILRPNPLRLPLIAGGILVLLLWLLAPWLRAAFIAS